MVSPTGCRLWKVMLLPSRERYSSSRTDRSSFWASSSAPKLRASCRAPRMIWVMATVNASDSSTLVSGTGWSMALNASPVSTGTTAARAAFPTAPATIRITIHQCGRTCDQIQRTGLVRSVVCARCMENSRGAVTDIEVDSTTSACATIHTENRFLQQQVHVNLANFSKEKEKNEIPQFDRDLVSDP